MAGKEQGSLRSPLKPVAPPPRASSPAPKTDDDLRAELKAVKNELARAKEEIARLQEQVTKSRAKSEHKETEVVRRNSSEGKQQRYPNFFKSNFFTVEEQARVGLKTNSALVAYLNKVNNATLAYATHIAHANKHFPWQEFGGDGMTSFLVVLGELQSQLGQSAATAAHSSQIMGTALERLQAENTSLKHRLQAISEQHKAAVKDVLPLFQTRQSIIEKYSEWQVYNYKKELNKAWDRKQLVETNLAKFEALQADQHIKDSMTTYESTMRPLLGMIEDVEEARLNALQNCLHELCNCSCIMGPWTGNLVESIGSLSKNSAIQEFSTLQASVQVPHILTWKQELSADFFVFQKPLNAELSLSERGRKLSITLSNSLRPRKPSLSPSRRSNEPMVPPSPSSASFSSSTANVTGTIMDVIECLMMTPLILEATHDYPGTGAESDLVFRAGDLIKLLSPLGVDLSQGVVWCTGRDLASGAQGRFPSNYVTVCNLH